MKVPSTFRYSFAIVSIVTAFISSVQASELPDDYFGAGACTVSWKAFRSLKPGIRYEEAVSILGCRATEKGPAFGATNSKTYEWYGKEEAHCRLIAIFNPGLIENPIRPTAKSKKLDLNFDSPSNGYQCHASEWVKPSS
jgi:hypothetical protein